VFFLNEKELIVLANNVFEKVFNSSKKEAFSKESGLTKFVFNSIQNLNEQLIKKSLRVEILMNDSLNNSFKEFEETMISENVFCKTFFISIVSTFNEQEIVKLKLSLIHSHNPFKVLKPLTAIKSP
jgi:hypothetical protein